MTDTTTPSAEHTSEPAEDSATDAPPAPADLFRESEIAADYVEGLLDILDYDGDIDELISAGRPVVEVVGGYRAARRKELSVIAKNADEKVEQFVEHELLGMVGLFELKCVHDVINAL